MIDFRYHLVSLVSVFMALAIGVVLGAGPLKESLGDTLTNQVQALRTDKEALQQAVDNRDAEIAGRDQLLTTLGESLLPGQLAGHQVAVITLPGAEQEAIDPLLDDLATAGAQVTTTVAVQARWTDPAEAAFRSELAGQLVQYLDTPPDAATGTDGELAVLLARSVLTTQSGGTDRGGPLAQTLDGLVAGELVRVAEEQPRQADLAVVVGGPPQELADAEAAEAARATNSSYLSLLANADAEAAGAVVVAPRSSDAEDGLLSEVRADADLTEALSSVDNLGSPGGRLSVVLALREQVQGRAGQYGTGESAQSAAPAYAAPAPQETPGEEPTDAPTGDG